MNTNLRFAISIHALTLLATSSDPLTSEAIATSVDTNPVVVRRAMASLREHGLVESKPGAHGGWRLLRAPSQIGLCEVYRSLGSEDVLAMHSHPNQHCRVGAHIKGALTGIFATAQAGMENALGKYTIADVLTDVLARGEK
ncbi:MAG: Rrf2 family transcriptional regulator [Chloroflexi bacterium]|nr:Rrf2 family transcriptional regulator [Chloroflexota bacterium]